MRVCPVCEGYTGSQVDRCSTCDAPLVETNEVAWASRDGELGAGSPWVGVVVGGKYRITGVLGQGGMGTVYRAVHELTLAPVALKVLHPRLARRRAFKERLIGEARKASLLRSAHVARVLDVGETPEGSVFFAMEIVEGETLHAWLQRGPRCGPWLVVEVLRQLCDALLEAHAQGIVHRDLSPKNVMLEVRTGVLLVKVLDFGIAYHGESELVEEEAASTSHWVNPPFTAPEVLRGEAPDARSDLYSLGVIAYGMLSGKLPHGGTALADRVRAVLEDEPLPLEAPRGTPRALRGLVRHLMARDPAGRPRDVAAVRQVLADLDRPHGLFLRLAAAASLVVGLAAFLTGLAAPRHPALLTSSRSGGFVLSPLPLAAADPPQYLQSQVLQRLVLEAADLRLGELAVHCYTGGTEPALVKTPRAPIVQGTLTLEAERDADWRAVVDFCRRTRAAVNLDFRHEPTGKVLGFAKVFVDDEPPDLQLQAQLDANLSLSSRLLARVVESSQLTGLAFELRFDDVLVAVWHHPLGEGPLGDIQVELGRQLAQGAVAGESLDGREGAWSLVWDLSDAAGHRTRRPQYLAGADLSIPVISGVTAGDETRVCRVIDGSCRVRLHLDRSEARLDSVKARAYRPGQPPLELVASEYRLAGRVLTMELAVPPLAMEAQAVTLELVDRSGNRSDPYPAELRFQDLDLEARLSLLPESAGLAAIDDGQETIWLAGPRVEVDYVCNPAYVPSPVVPEGASLPIAVVGTPEPGRCRLAIGPCPEPGEVMIGLVHRPSAEPEAPLQARRPLRLCALPAPPRLSIDPVASSGRAWLPELLDRGVLGLASDNRLVPRGLVLPPFSRLRARLWLRRGEAWLAQPWSEVVASSGLEQLAFEPAPGRNVVALEAVDPIGRSLVAPLAENGGTSALTIDGRAAMLLASFRHDPVPPRPAEAFVEHGVEAVVQVRTSEPLDRGSEVRLSARRQHQAPVMGVVRDSPRGGSLCLFRVGYQAHLVSWCAWQSLPAEGFAERPPSSVECQLETPAGRFDLTITFRPTRSLLRATALDDLLPAGILPAPLRGLSLAPFRVPGGTTVTLGPPRQASTRGSVCLEPPVAVADVGDYYLATTEISRRAYAEFRDDVLWLASHGLDRRLLGHAEDPLGEARFTAAGLEPDTAVFGDCGLEALVAAGGDRPITGVSYYQAQAFARWLGWRFFAEADLFRLPFGAELEWAALGPAGGRDPVPLNGLHVPEDLQGQAVRPVYAACRERAGSRPPLDPAAWPLTAAELVAIGDHALDEHEQRVFGLDFGVREWCEDLPLVGVDAAYRLRADNHAAHRELARRRRAGAPLGVVLLPELRNGELRGMGFGEPVVGGRDPLADLETTPVARFDTRLLGVKRLIYAPRDGQGLLPGTRSPLVSVAGFRVAGGAELIRRVREVVR